MKIIQKQTAPRSIATQKENQPANALQKMRNKAENKKTGQDIKQKIQKTTTTQEGLTERDTNIPEDRLSPKLTKSVSFDHLERTGSPAMHRHNSKKSILKNSLSKMQSSLSLKSSQISLANSHAGSQDQSTQHTVGNKVVRQKYERALQQLKKQQKKYRDQVYPPNQTSIYLNNSLMRNFCQMLEKDGRAVEWMRIPEIFKNRQLTLCSSDRNCTVDSGPLSRSADYLPGAFNLVGQRLSLLQRFFQGQQVNQEGIYLVKIHMTQQSIWKYVIIDDYIPVIINKRLPLHDRYLPENVVPAFLSVHSNDNRVDIWPFLLQKAYAKYYSTYDSLANGNIYDFVEEISGVFMQTLPISQQIHKVLELVRNEDAIVLAQDRKGGFHPLKNIKNSESGIAFLDRQTNFSQRILTYQQFSNTFTNVRFAHLHRYFLSSKCMVQQEQLRSSREEGFLLRHIEIDEACQCQIGVVQKQQRFFRALLTYEYAWIRIILVQRQSNGYRWISAAYNNSKSVKMSVSLTTGHYILIIIPQWKAKKYDFQLVYFGNTPASFQRRPYEPYRNIVPQSCMDLAQRYGKMAQINKNLCSYHHIQRTVGFIIQNINNQKEHGSVRVVRSIQGLQQFAIRPLNQQFKGRKAVEMAIGSMGHFTVVLMTTGGTNEQILNMFDFGCNK